MKFEVSRCFSGFASQPIGEILDATKGRNILLDFTFIRDLINKPKDRTAVQIREALGSLDVKGAEAAVEALEKQRHALLLKGDDAEIEKFEVRIKAGNREVERQYAARTELTRLLAMAEAAEAAANIEARASSARDTQASMLRCFVEIDTLATRLAELLDEVDIGRRKIHEVNHFLSENGHREMKIPYPEIALSEHLGLPTPESLPRLSTWVLHGYKPRLPDSRLLGRARELLSERNRKAA
jgi:hypothetical protein